MPSVKKIVKMFKQSSIHSRLLRLNTARGSGTGLVTVGTTKVMACKSLCFTKDVSDVEIIN